MDPFTFISLIILGFFYAILASMIGIGGGLLYVPTLDFGFGLDTIDATFVSSFVIVFTKADKIPKTQLADTINKYKEFLLNQWEELPDTFVSSSTSGMGKEEILNFISETNDRLK